MGTVTTTRLRLVSADVGGPPSWGQATEEFLARLRLRRLSPHTLTWYRCVLAPFGRYLQEVARTDDPSAATEAHVCDFLERMGSEGAAGRGGVGARRLNHYREGLRRFYAWLQERGEVGHNPAAGIGKVREEQKLIAALTADQVQELLRQPDRRRFLGLRDFCSMLFLLDTGLRVSEALSLRVADLELAEGAVTVMGKGNKERRVGLSRSLLCELRPYLRRREAAVAEIGCPESPWLFPNDCGGRLSRWAMQKRLRQYGEQAGIRGVRVSPHTLRHTYALHFVRRGGDPFTLQKILGHTTLAMTRRYCDLAESDVLQRQRELSPLETMNLPALRFPKCPGARKDG